MSFLEVHFIVQKGKTSSDLNTNQLLIMTQMPELSIGGSEHWVSKMKLSTVIFC